MKKVSALFLGVLLCFSLCSCGGNRSANTNGTVSQQKTAAKKESDETTKKEKKLTEISLGDKITLDFAEITVDES